MAFGSPAEVLDLVQAKGPMLAVDEDEIEVELPQNVDHPWGGEGKVIAVRLASGPHGGFDSVGLLHGVSSCVRRLRSECSTAPSSRNQRAGDGGGQRMQNEAKCATGAAAQP